MRLFHLAFGRRGHVSRRRQVSSKLLRPILQGPLLVSSRDEPVSCLFEQLQIDFLHTVLVSVHFYYFVGGSTF
ncbi:hypothetical protein K402DRAFT_190975 [Aulographum hederae CBS 113979]|uniref:Uncharacterized protein n=1 Tax=Aulographum hederae CBS 113979 TaxID=1176131 RepID=A0A6G1GP67_9PEZI|nr:hypothetical protein K402DRAFT_190975 [Aulographum hederae CBS 113979]